MRALRYYEPGKVAIEEMPQPEIGLGEVLVKVRACGVCATDVKAYRRGHPKIRPGAVLGHEIAGVIAATEGVDGWKVGDRVAVAPYAPCGECSQCRRGNFTLCRYLFVESAQPGGFAEYVRVPPRLVNQGLLPLPAALSFVEASLAEPLACCLHGLEALQVGPNDSLLVIGDGPMGLLQAEVARALGASPVLLSGMMPERLARAAQVADIVIDAGREDVGEIVRRHTGGGANKVIVSVAEAVVAQDALEIVSKGGAVNLFAGMPTNARILIDGNRIHYDEIRLLGTFGFAPGHFRQAVEWLAHKQVNIRGLVTTTGPLTEVESALEAAAKHRGIKSVVVFNEKEESME